MVYKKLTDLKLTFRKKRQELFLKNAASFLGGRHIAAFQISQLYQPLP